MLVSVVRLALALAVAFAPAATVALAGQESQIDSRGLDRFEAGQSAHEQGRTEEALKLYDEALALDPELWGAHFQRGVALLQLARPADAEKALRRAIELEADFAAAYAALGQALLDLDRPRDAEQVLARALTLNPEITGARINYANALARREAWVEADRELERVEREKGATAQALQLRGEVLTRLNQAPAAIAAYGRALEVDPKLHTARRARAALRAEAGDAAGAADDLEVVYAAGATPELAAELSELELKSGRTDRAVERYRAAAAERPADPAPRRALVDLLIRAGRSEEAAKEVEALVAASPDDPRALELAGDLLAPRSPLDAARFYARAARAAPQSVEYRLKLGAALVQGRRFADAIEALSFVVARRPDSREGRANLAAAFFGAAQYNEAAREFRWVAEREPESAMTYYYLGASLERVGNCQDALAAFERFLAAADSQKLKFETSNVALHVPALKRQIENGSCDKVRKEFEKKGRAGKDAKAKG